VPEHVRGDLEVGDDSVPKRTDRANCGGCTPDHPASLLADRVHGIGGLVDRNHGWLEDDDALAANEDERVRRTEVDRQFSTTREALQSHGPRLTLSTKHDGRD